MARLRSAGQRVSEAYSRLEISASGRNGPTPMLVLCSRNAHYKNVLVRRPHLYQHGGPSRRGKASELGRINEMDDGRSMRAVKGSLGHSPRERYRELEGARSTRALEDRPCCPLKNKTSELGGSREGRLEPTGTSISIWLLKAFSAVFPFQILIREGDYFVSSLFAGRSNHRAWRYPFSIPSTLQCVENAARKNQRGRESFLAAVSTASCLTVNKENVPGVFSSGLK
jgi:hypothetical protein